MSLPCRDVYEAIERHSALLLRRIYEMAQPLGWPVRPYSWMLRSSGGHLCSVVATTLSLPYGRGASFTPRHEPKSDGLRWAIDIRRTDRLLRGDWAQGLLVVAVAPQQFELLHGDRPLSDATLRAILEDLARP